MSLQEKQPDKNSTGLTPASGINVVIDNQAEAADRAPVEHILCKAGAPIDRTGVIESAVLNPLTGVKPVVVGKFLMLAGETFYIKGVTYGTFKPQESGDQYPVKEVVSADFKRMAQCGINTVRVYTVPPVWLLDMAAEHGLYLMIGIPWEQHIAILGDPKLVSSIKQRFKDAVSHCSGHPAVLCYSIGNEIPAHVVRWHSPKKIERFLHQLYKIVKKDDPNTLVTYVNFPTTEFLRLDFVDFYCFNVYLESEERLRAYLPRLQVLAANKPLVLAEVGLDSERNGLDGQRDSLSWQIDAIYENGCAGSFVFAWTDEWYVGGRPIDDWWFGLTTHERHPKPALTSVAKAYDRAPFDSSLVWPSFTVVVCSYNGSKTIRTTLESLAKLDYPNYEVVVVDDGSTDSTAEIAKQFEVKLISTTNHGLSSARNTGYQAGTGEIVAYIDDDAFPEAGWLRYLALAYMHNDFVSVGGPNYPVAGDGLIADCVANAPGGPMEVMLTDTIAEHIPGCNMSFKRTALDAIGGFDPQFRAAGDDVDVCWRIQDEVGDIGFHASAFNWHHRRDTVKGYWKQQFGYGVAEALLEKKWPEKYNSSGHIGWSGRLYGQGFTQHLGFNQGRIYQGVWGSSPFQRLYNGNTNSAWSLTLMPEWLLLIAALTLLTMLSVAWKPMLWVGIPLAAAVGVYLTQAVVSASKGSYDIKPGDYVAKASRVVVTSILHVIQPVARLRGRLQNGLSPWRTTNANTSTEYNVSSPKTGGFWDGKNVEVTDRLTQIYKFINQTHLTTVGNSYDNWDLEVSGGLIGSTRLSLMVEQHAEGVEHVRYRCKRTMPKLAACILLLSIALSAVAVIQARWWLATVCAAVTVAIAYRLFIEGRRSANVAIAAVKSNVDQKIEKSVEQPLATEATAVEEIENVAA